MLRRSFTLAGGLAGAAALSQFPEYSQQYAQRLGGAVDELRIVVQDFDRDAAALDLSRDAALADLSQGGEMGAARAASMVRTFERFDRLRDDLAALDGQGPFMRAYHGARFTDGEIARRAWQAYRPAMPVTLEGLIFAGVGFILGGGVIALVWRLVVRVVRQVFRQRRNI